MKEISNNQNEDTQKKEITKDKDGLQPTHQPILEFAR
jgi:hypothetical protein